MHCPRLMPLDETQTFLFSHLGANLEGVMEGAPRGVGCHREAAFVMTEGTRATTRHETALRTEETAYERTGNRSFMTQVRMANGFGASNGDARNGARLFPYAVASLTHTRARSLAPPQASPPQGAGLCVWVFRIDFRRMASFHWKREKCCLGKRNVS